MTFGSLFAGIGGMDLGLERAGMTCKWQVEIDGYCQRVLAKHWPHVRRHDDVRTFPPDDGTDWGVDLIAGGFPCQDISFAGKGAGLIGERSGLWYEFARIVREIRPSFVLVENVAALSFSGLGRVLSDLSEIGFNAEWQTIRASDFALPHRRERTFIVAYANAKHGKTRLGPKQDWPDEVFPSDLQQRDAVHVQTADHFVGVDDGVRGRAYRLRGETIGNAVVPQVAEWIGRRIMEAAAA